jgi:uncharacterized protein YggE
MGIMSHSLAAALVVVVCSAGLASAQAPASPAATAEPALIVVSGHADATIPADRAMVRIAVETRAETAAAAGAENARIQEAVVAALRAAGVPRAAITSAGYTVATNYRPPAGPRETPQPDGYIARNAVHVQLSALDRVGPVIDAALAAGANRIDGVQFTATQTDSARRVALAEAIATARADATIMARAAGGSLGRLLELSTEFSPARMPYALQMAGGVARARATTEIEPREVTVNAVVVGRWEFEPAR